MENKSQRLVQDFLPRQLASAAPYANNLLHISFLLWICAYGPLLALHVSVWLPQVSSSGTETRLHPSAAIRGDIDGPSWRLPAALVTQNGAENEAALQKGAAW